MLSYSCVLNRTSTCCASLWDGPLLVLWRSLLDLFHCSFRECVVQQYSHSHCCSRPYKPHMAEERCWEFPENIFVLTTKIRSCLLTEFFFQRCGSAFCLRLISDHRSFIRFELRPAVTRSLPLRWWSYIQVPLKSEVCFDNPTCLPTSVSGAGPLWSAPN